MVNFPFPKADQLNFKIVLQPTATAAAILMLNIFKPSCVATTNQSEYFALLCGGFSIPTNHYQSFLNLLIYNNPTLVGKIVEDQDTILTNDSLAHYANAIIEELECLPNLSSDRLSPRPFSDNVILFGHSRGGAAAALASTMLRDPSKIKSLILLDPVDDDHLTATSHIHHHHQHPFPILIVSTPYGGRSKYYGKSYESACAPPERSSKIFFSSLQDSDSNFPRLLVTLPQIGHLELLDDINKLSLAKICASSEGSLQLTARKVIGELLTNWFLDIHHFYQLPPLPLTNNNKRLLPIDLATPTPTPSLSPFFKNTYRYLSTYQQTEDFLQLEWIGTNL